MIHLKDISIWLYAGLITVAVFLVGYYGKKIMVNRLRISAPTTKTDWDDLAGLLLERIHDIFLLLLALYAGSLVLPLSEDVSDLFGKLFVVAFLFQAALIGNRAIALAIKRYRQRKTESNIAATTTLGSIGFVLQLLLWFSLLLVALDNFGINITTLIAGLGIGGIAVALAVQNILGDLFASFSIVFDKPFVIGDFIIVGDFLGTVEYVGLKTTRIRSLSGEQLIFSNADLLQSRIRNFKRMQERRVVFTIGVRYQTPHKKLQALPGMIKEIIEERSDVRFDRAHFKEYGAYSLNFEIVFWIMNPDYNVFMDIQQAINLSLYECFEENGIEFAYPTQKIIIEKDELPSKSPNSFK